MTPLRLCHYSDYITPNALLLGKRSCFKLVLSASSSSESTDAACVCVYQSKRRALVSVYDYVVRLYSVVIQKDTRMKVSMDA